MIAADEAEVREEEIVIECDLDATPEKVWRALTVPALVDEWLGVSSSEAAGDEERSYEIIEAEPFSRLRYAWRDPATTQPATIVTFDLSPLPDGGTSFRLTHGLAPGTPLAAANNNSPPAALAA